MKLQGHISQLIHEQIKVSSLQLRCLILPIVLYGERLAVVRDLFLKAPSAYIFCLWSGAKNKLFIDHL